MATIKNNDTSRQVRNKEQELKRAKEKLNSDLASARLIAMNLGDQNLSKVSKSEIKNFQELTRRIQSDDGKFSLSNKEIESLTSLQKKLDAAAEYMVQSNHNYNYSLTDIIHNFAVTIGDSKNSSSSRNRQLGDLKKVLAKSGQDVSKLNQAEDLDPTAIAKLMQDVGDKTISAKNLAKVAPSAIYSQDHGDTRTRKQKAVGHAKNFGKSALKGAASHATEGLLDATFNHLGLGHVNQQFKFADKIHGAIFNKIDTKKDDNPFKSVIHDMHDNTSKVAAFRDFAEPPDDGPINGKKKKSDTEDVKVAPKSFKPKNEDSSEDSETPSRKRRRSSNSSGGGFDKDSTIRIIDLLADTMEYQKTLVKNSETTNDKLNQLVKVLDPIDHNVDTSKSNRKIEDDIDPSVKSVEVGIPKSNNENDNSKDKEGFVDKAKDWLKSTAGSLVKKAGSALLGVGSTVLESGVLAPAAIASGGALAAGYLDRKFNPLSDPNATDEDHKSIADGFKNQSWTNFLTGGMLDKEHGIGSTDLPKASNANQTITSTSPSETSTQITLPSNQSTPTNEDQTSSNRVSTSSNFNEIVPLLKKETQILIKLDDTLSALINSLSKGNGGSGSSTSSSSTGSTVNGGSTSSGGSMTPTGGGLGNVVNVTKTPRGNADQGTSTPSVSAAPTTSYSKISPEQLDGLQTQRKALTDQQAQLRSSGDVGAAAALNDQVGKIDDQIKAKTGMSTKEVEAAQETGGQLSYASANASLHGENEINGGAVVKNIDSKAQANDEKIYGTKTTTNTGNAGGSSGSGVDGAASPPDGSTPTSKGVEDNKALLASSLKKSGLNAAEREQVFGQIGAESKFTPKSESMNYKPEQLAKVFPRFVHGVEDAKALLAQGPEAVGNRIYGTRMGNNGEGYKFRGRGLVQLTGRENYEHYGKLTGLDLVKNPDLANDPANAAKIAAAYYKEHKDRGFNLATAEGATKATGPATEGAVGIRKGIAAQYAGKTDDYAAKGDAMYAGATAKADTLPNGTPMSGAQKASRDLASHGIGSGPGDSQSAGQKARGETPSNASPTGSAAAAVDIEHSFLGKQDGRKHKGDDSQELNGFLQKNGVKWDVRSGKWCAAFVGASLNQAGVKGTQGPDKLMARSYNKWGQTVDDLSKINKGDVLVKKDGSHVLIADGQTRMRNGQLEVHAISGNEGKQVAESWEPAGNLNARRATAEEAKVTSKAVEIVQDHGVDKVNKNLAVDKPPDAPSNGTINSAENKALAARSRTETNVPPAKPVDNAAAVGQIHTGSHGPIGQASSPISIASQAKSQRQLDDDNLSRGIVTTDMRKRTEMIDDRNNAVAKRMLTTRDKDEISPEEAEYQKVKKIDDRNDAVEKRTFHTRDKDETTSITTPLVSKVDQKEAVKVAATNPIVNQAPPPPPKPVNPTNPPVNSTAPMRTESVSAGNPGSGRAPITPSSHGKDGHKKPGKHVDDLMLAAYNRGLLHHNVG